VVRKKVFVRHGFTSQMLMGMLVHDEGEGVATYGKGGRVFTSIPARPSSSASPMIVRGNTLFAAISIPI
jgi:hypothetical protein